MKFKTLIFSVLVAFLCIPAYANKDKVLGVWLTQDKDSKVEITKDQYGKYYGKIVWLKNPTENGIAKLDDENPDEKLRTRPIMGLTLLSGFEYDEGDEEWNSGTIYDPKSGNTYKCYMWFGTDNNVLNVKGYVGVSIIGRKVAWTRER